MGCEQFDRVLKLIFAVSAFGLTRCEVSGIFSNSFFWQDVVFLEQQFTMSFVFTLII